MILCRSGLIQTDHVAAQPSFSLAATWTALAVRSATSAASVRQMTTIVAFRTTIAARTFTDERSSIREWAWWS